MKVVGRRCTGYKDSTLLGEGSVGAGYRNNEGIETFSIHVDTYDAHGHYGEYNFHLETDSQQEMVRLITRLLICAVHSDLTSTNSFSYERLSEIEQKIKDSLTELGLIK